MEVKEFKIVRFINGKKVFSTMKLSSKMGEQIADKMSIVVEVANYDGSFTWDLESTDNPEIRRIPSVDGLIGFTMNPDSEEYGDFYINKDDYIDFLESLINILAR